ncbi:hypothetical protein MMC10_005896 [Thelotrema lepadinum]|nr:hypothetical protein [Thelotrema lepadinum]
MASRTSSEATLRAHSPEKQMLLESQDPVPVWNHPRAKSQQGTIRLLVAWLALLSLLSGTLLSYTILSHSTPSLPNPVPSTNPVPQITAASPSRIPLLTAATGPPLISQDSPPLDCGRTVDEAKAAGCIFDVMSFHWVPPQCYDAEITDLFLAARDWKWYSKYHGNASDEIPIETIREGHTSAWVPWEYHPVHCTHQWRKMHRAFAAGRPLDSALGNYNHTLHCEEMLWRGEWYGKWVVNTKVERKFVSCGFWY